MGVEVGLYLLRNIMAKERLQLQVSRGNTAVNKWDAQWGSYNSSGPHFLLQNEDINKAPSLSQAQTFCANLHEGRFRKLIFQSTELCGIIAWRIKLLFITVHFLSLAYQPVFIKHHLLCSTMD